MTVIAYDFVCRSVVENAQAGHPLEEPVHRSFSISRRGWCDTGQPFLDGTFQCGFDILAGQPRKLLHELIDLCGTNIHASPKMT